MTNLGLAICGVLTAIAVSGCNSLPHEAADRRVGVAEIVDRVQCEIQQAIESDDYLKKLLPTYNARAELELELIDSGDVAAGAAMIIPNFPEVITATFGGGVGGSATRKTTLSFAMDLAKIKHRVCSLPTGLPGATDSLGLATWIKTAFLAVDDRDQAGLSEATYQVKFIAIVNANGGITISAYRINSATIGGKAGRQHTHTLTVALSPKPGATPAAKVAIVSWPGLSASSGVQTWEAPQQGQTRAETGRQQQRPASRGPFRPTDPGFDRLDTLIQRERFKTTIIER
ncbi:hypothetical protein J2Y55_004593 [Bosea sp. BE125]|uniref:hypothetical protein n=1 Tax=Bosea sp. BE125 TaxID=2817909 RepID=UPI0028621429|nr:hypothetical protein [Bosea sp. BE125]MDR6873566.1 hypothetical protein [Bosea sp. BE125]